MKLHRLSVIALSNRDFSSLAEKLAEAVGWLEIAAGQGAELAVLPELLNRVCGDGYGNSKRKTAREVAFDDWRSETAPLIEAAVRLQIWVTVPVLHRIGDDLYNSFFLISPEGEPVWRYDKVSPTPEELDAGVVAAAPTHYDWKGVRLGGGICFDTCFPENLERQALEGVQLFLIPSLWPGGSQLNHLCKLRSTRVAISYPAWSRIIDIDGLEVAEGGYRQETLRFGFGAPVYTATLNFDRVSLYGNHNQEKMIPLARKYGRRVKISYDQGNCLWFLESLDPDLQESDLLQEFELTTAANYFAGCARRILECAA